MLLSLSPGSWVSLGVMRGAGGDGGRARWARQRGGGAAMTDRLPWLSYHSADAVSCKGTVL